MYNFCVVILCSVKNLCNFVVKSRRDNSKYFINLNMYQPPYFSVRFYIRIYKRQRGADKTPLCLRVWIKEQKRSLFASSGIEVTPEQWKHFDTEGKPQPGADIEITQAVTICRDTIRQVIAAAYADGSIEKLTSADLKRSLSNTTNREGKNNGR